jgi:hypothetical protein
MEFSSMEISMELMEFHVNGIPWNSMENSMN